MTDPARPSSAVAADRRLNRSDHTARIDFTNSSNIVCGYAVIMLAAGVLLINPLVLSLVAHMSMTRTIYLTFFDGLLIAIIVFCLRHLRRGQRRDLVAAIAIAALVPLAMILIEPAIVAAHEAWQRGAGDEAAEAAVHRPDPLLGWEPVPGAHARHVSEGNFDVTYVIDAQGDKLIPANPGATRTLHFFGDSILFGHGVANDQTALNLVADKLGRRANVVNHGVMAYGLEQMFLRLRESKDQVRQGDAVIFAPIAEDLERNLIGKTFVCEIYRKSYAEARTFPLLDNGEWRAEPIDEYCPEGDLPIALARRYLMAWRRPGLDRELAANADVIFGMARALAEERGADFFLLFLVRADECDAKAFLFDLDLLETPYSSLMPYCPLDSSDLRFATDRHFNVKGQQWLAAAILDFLERDVLHDR